MTAAKADRQSSRRVLRLLWVLQGHVVEGLRLTQIAEAMGSSLPTTLRDLETMRDEGVAERIPGREDCWRMTPKLGQIAAANAEEFARLRRRIDEFENRYTREPK